MNNNKISEYSEETNKVSPCKSTRDKSFNTIHKKNKETEEQSKNKARAKDKRHTK